jgi:Domain of unknown function (DUF4136)
MMRRVLLTIPLLLMLIASGYAQKVKVKYDKGVDFTKFKTYSWSQGVGARNPIINDLIKDSVEKELADRGLEKVEKDGDVRVLFFAGVDFGVSTSHGTWGNAVGSPVQTGMPALGSWAYREGTLALDFIENSSNKFIWRGLANQALSEGPTANAQKDAKRVENVVKKAVAKMFKQFPRPIKSA